jgi:sporulation protein YlmC with PRC-barrel domain
MDIPMRAKVRCVDGLGGQPTMLVVDPANKRITHLVVKERQSPQAERLVPIRYVKDTTDEAIRLTCSRHEISEMQPLVRTEFVRVDMPDADGCPRQSPDIHYVVPKWIKVRHRSIPRGQHGVRRGARVAATDGVVGRLEEFVIDPGSGNISHLLIRDGQLWERERVMIPGTEIERIEEGTVHLTLDKTGVKALATTPIRRKRQQTDSPRELVEGHEQSGNLGK